MRFTPNEDFHEAELGSRYIKGLQYTVRPEDDKLREFVTKWIKHGKVRVLDGASPPSKIMGVGKVT